MFLVVYPQIVNKLSGRITSSFIISLNFESLDQFILWIRPFFKIKKKKKKGSTKCHLTSLKENNKQSRLFPPPELCI